MTTGILLYTHKNMEDVLEDLSRVGFSNEKLRNQAYLHNSIPDLAVQVDVTTQYGFNTFIQVDDYTDRFPDNEDAIGILNEMYKSIHDLCYQPIIVNTPDPRPLEEYLHK